MEAALFKQGPRMRVQKGPLGIKPAPHCHKILIAGKEAIQPVGGHKV